MACISLVMIARDEARSIERCLRSAAGWVDAMWVLDTGSVDDTPAIARRCGFATAAYLCTAFGAAHGVAPGAWRKQQGA